MATTQVILKEKIASLGAEGDIVKVRTGYARNFLLPKAKAYEATAGNLRQQANLQKVRAEREAKELEEAEKLSSKLKKLKIKLTLATGQGGKAFGSITTKDIVEAVAASTAKVMPTSTKNSDPDSSTLVRGSSPRFASSTSQSVSSIGFLLKKLRSNSHSMTVARNIAITAVNAR